MNCDQVFDVLTRGPFPTGCTGDAAVERHLAACHECRELAEALQPAVNLFHETLAAESSALPGYRGMYSESSVACLPAALRAALEEDSPRSPTANVVRTRPASRWGIWNITAALSLAPAAILAVVAAIWFAPGIWQDRTAAARFQPTEAGREWLVSLSLPTKCFDAGPTLAVNNASLGPATAHLGLRHDCCLKCHGQENPARPSLDATAALDSSCHVCHNY